LKNYFVRLLSLLLGLFLFAVGIVLTMKANIGYAPWDVLHSGVSELTGISFGTVSILIGILICFIVVAVGEKLGLGTILNMVLIGTFINVLLGSNLIPTIHGFLPGLIVLIIGLFVISFGSYFYIKAGFGAGPRDYLMVVIRRKTHLPVGVSRGLVEGSAVLFGWALGGSVGGGTVLAAFGISFCIQAVFSLMKFESTTIQHETLGVTFRNINNLLRVEKSDGVG
jgi:uncharacterized membrane protein YczE